MSQLSTGKKGFFIAHNKYRLSSLLFTILIAQGFWRGQLLSSEQLITDANSPDKPSEVPSKGSKFFTKVDPILEVKAGYFFFATSEMRKIYDQGGLDLQLSGTFPIWRGLQGYVSVEYLEKHGKTLSGGQKTSVWEIPVSLGLKPVITIRKDVHYYLTLGPRYFYFHQHNSSSYLKKDIGRSGAGFFINTGFNFFPIDHLVIDFFGEYSYERVSIGSFSSPEVYGTSAQVGGFTFGGGLGYAF